MDERIAEATTCPHCGGKGRVWSDCGDSTCDCDGSEYPCGRCKNGMSFRVTDRLLGEEIAQAVLTERERCLAIVRDQTPTHFTREYRPTDAMRDAICREIRGGGS